MKELNESTLIICSIVRDAENGLIKNIPIIKALCSKCKDYKIVIYENDSMDKTKEWLKEWSKTDAKVHALLNNTDKSQTIPLQHEVKGNPFFSYKRISKMAQLRNNYMDYIREKGWNADYLVVVDLDVAKLEIDGILSSFRKGKEWDAVTAFGHSLSPRLKRRYHDTYALTEYGDEQNPQTESKIKNLAVKYGNLKATDEWVRVFSAFGGLAIYKFEAVKNLHYEVMENADNRVEVRCEHFSIYWQMAKAGYSHVYINPAMQLKYQKLTFHIVWQSLCRNFNKLTSHQNEN